MLQIHMLLLLMGAVGMVVSEPPGQFTAGAVIRFPPDDESHLHQPVFNGVQGLRYFAAGPNSVDTLAQLYHADNANSGGQIYTPGQVLSQGPVYNGHSFPLNPGPQNNFHTAGIQETQQAFASTYPPKYPAQAFPAQPSLQFPSTYPPQSFPSSYPAQSYPSSYPPQQYPSSPSPYPEQHLDVGQNPFENHPIYGNPFPNQPAQNPSQFPNQPEHNPNPFPNPPAQNPNPFPNQPAQNPNPFPNQPAQNPNPFQNQPAQNPNPFPQQPSYGPNPFPNQPAHNPNPFPQQPAHNPNPFPSQPAHNPNPFPNQPTSNPNPFPNQPAHNPNPFPNHNPNPFPSSQPSHNPHQQQFPNENNPFPSDSYSPNPHPSHPSPSSQNPHYQKPDAPKPHHQSPDQVNLTHKPKRKPTYHSPPPMKAFTYGPPKALTGPYRPRKPVYPVSRPTGPSAKYTKPKPGSYPSSNAPAIYGTPLRNGPGTRPPTKGYPGGITKVVYHAPQQPETSYNTITEEMLGRVRAEEEKYGGAGDVYQGVKYSGNKYHRSSVEEATTQRYEGSYGHVENLNTEPQHRVHSEKDGVVHHQHHQHHQHHHGHPQNAPVIVYKGVRPPVSVYHKPQLTSIKKNPGQYQQHANDVPTELEGGRAVAPLFTASPSSWLPINAPEGAVPARAYDMQAPDLSRTGPNQVYDHQQSYDQHTNFGQQQSYDHTNTAEEVRGVQNEAHIFGRHESNSQNYPRRPEVGGEHKFPRRPEMTERHVGEGGSSEEVVSAVVLVKQKK